MRLFAVAAAGLLQAAIAQPSLAQQALECLVGARPCLTPGTDVGVVEEAQVIFRGICTACDGAV